MTLQRRIIPWILATPALVLASMAFGAARDPAAAEALFKEGRDAAKGGDWATACRRFADSQRLDPAAGTLLNLALCEEHLGQTATAWQHFREAADQFEPSDERRGLARSHASALEPRLPRLAVSLDPGAPPNTAVKRDAVELTATMMGIALPVDPGVHVLVISAPGYEARTERVSIAAGQLLRVQVGPGPATAGTDTDRDTGTQRGSGLSHDGQVGFSARADVDGKGRGAVIAPGLAYGLGDFVELGAGGLLGRDQGAYLNASAFVLRGAFKPLITVEVPVFFTEGAHAGIRGAAGLQWDASYHLGVFVAAGVTRFLSAPAGFDKTVFVPSFGVQARL